MHVAHVEAGAIAAEAARTKRRQAPLVRQLGQRVGLVHELGQLAATEELLDAGDDGADVDQSPRRGRTGVLDGHALLNDALHAQQADAELVLQQFADGAHPAVAQVIDVVLAHHAGVAVDRVVGLDQAFDDGHQVVARQRAAGHGRLQGQALVELIAADAAEVVAARVKEERLHQRAGVLLRGRVARAQLLIDLE